MQNFEPFDLRNGGFAQTLCVALTDRSSGCTVMPRQPCHLLLDAAATGTMQGHKPLQQRLITLTGGNTLLQFEQLTVLFFYDTSMVCHI